MDTSLPSIADAAAFLSALSGNVYAILGLISTLLTFAPFSMIKRRAGRFGRWLSSKPENKRLTFFIVGAALLLWASFQAFSDERAKLRSTQDQLAAIQGTLAGHQNQIASEAMRLSQFQTECLNLWSARIDKDQYGLWKKRHDEFMKELKSWTAENLGTQAEEKLLDMSVFTTGDITPQAVNPEHKEELLSLNKVCQNIVILIQDVAASARLFPGAKH